VISIYLRIYLYTERKRDKTRRATPLCTYASEIAFPFAFAGIYGGATRAGIDGWTNGKQSGTSAKFLWQFFFPSSPTRPQRESDDRGEARLCGYRERRWTSEIALSVIFRKPLLSISKPRDCRNSVNRSAKPLTVARKRSSEIAYRVSLSLILSK